MADEKIQHGAVAGSDDAAQRARIRAAEDARWRLVAELAGLGATMSAAMEAIPGFVPCGHAFGVVIDGLAAAAASDDAAELDELACAVRARSEHVAEHRGVAQGAVVDMRRALAAPSMRVQLLCALEGVALAAQRAMVLGAMSDDVDVALADGLAALLHEDDEYVHTQLVRMNAVAATACSLVA